MPRATLLVVATVLLCGCTPYFNVKAVSPEQGKTVLVVSTFGPTLRIKHVGAVVFQNRSATYDATSWHLDDTIEGIVEGAIVGSGKFRAVRSNSESMRSEFRAVGFNDDAAYLFGEPDCKVLVKQVADRSKLPLVLVVAPINRLDLPQPLQGYGIYQRSYVAGPNSGQTYTTLHMVLYSGATGDKIASITRHNSAPRDPASWLSDDLTLSPPNATSTREAVLSLFADDLPRALTDLGVD